MPGAEGLGLGLGRDIRLLPVHRNPQHSKGSTGPPGIAKAPDTATLSPIAVQRGGRPPDRGAWAATSVMGAGPGAGLSTKGHA